MIYDFFTFECFVSYHCIAGKEVVNHRTGNTMTGDKALKGKEVVNHRTGNTMTGDKTLKGKEVVNHRTGPVL
jgi:hypothetical protein